LHFLSGVEEVVSKSAKIPLARSKRPTMSNNISLTLFSAAIVAATVLLAPSAPSVAQGRSGTTSEFSAQQQQDKDKKATPAARPAQPRVQRAAPQTAAPRMAAPQRSAPRTVTQTKATSRVVTQPRATSRTVTQRKATSRTVTQRKATSRAVTQRKATSRAVTQRKATSRAVTQRKATSRAVTQRKATSRAVTQRKATSRAVTQRKAASRAVTQRKAAPRVVTPKGKRTVTASRLRGVPTQGVSSAVISGHNYSAWRSGHRVRHGRGWRTFVALSALGAIAIGSSEYYPYAYISAPENYCEGLTEDGCELMWQDVETIEGDIIPQCVAYCPWQ
jgi:hypothetical protein